MRTIKILRFEDVKVGDTVTLRKDSTGAEARGAVNALYDAGGDAWDVGISGFGPTFRMPGLWTLTDHQPAPAPEWEPGTVYEITTHDGDTMIAWCHSALDPDAWTAEECVTFVNRDGAEFLPGELKSATPRASVAETLRTELDAARTQVSDLTGRNAALEALVQEQKQGIQASDNWIEDQTADA